MAVQNLITVRELSLWATQDPDAIADTDEYALMVIDMASQNVAEEARHPEWRDDTSGVVVPFKAKLVCLTSARRAIVNPDGETRSAVGPISSGVREAMAYSLELTAAEKAELAALRGDGTTAEGLWLQPLAKHEATDMTAYVFDDSGSDWAIPYGDYATTDAFNEPDDVIL